MTRAAVHYAAAATTNRGRKRATNEDAFGFSIEHGVYMVCDGMGGAAGGEIASSVAVQQVLSILSERDPGSSLRTVAEEAVCAANREIYSRAQQNPSLHGMGTTLVAVLTEDSRVWVLNVGDSRCYRLRHERLERLTIDHSLVEEQVRLGRMTPQEAMHSPMRNVITRALGAQKCVTPDFFQVEAEPCDLFLLCSDGLTQELSDASIQDLLLADLPLEEQSQRLVEAAARSGGRDNITCLLVQAVA